jgi:hypothetical protein
MDYIQMNDVEKSILYFLNRRKEGKFFVFKLDAIHHEYYLGFAYPLWNPNMKGEHDKLYLKISKQELRIWKLNQILNN